MSDHESTTDASIVEPPNKTYKRRSSIFQANRRFQDGEIAKGQNEATPDAESPRVTEDDDFDIAAYTKKLRTERQCWKETLHKRKSKRRKLQRELEATRKQGAEYNLGLLCEAERSFVLARPAYRQIAKNVRELGAKATIVGFLLKETQLLRDQLASCMEKRISAAEKKIIKAIGEET